MGTVRILILLVYWTNLIYSLPQNTFIDCATASSVLLGEINEGYEGDIELGTVIGTDIFDLKIEPLCPRCDEFLDFIYIPLIPNFTVRTLKPLDIEALRETKLTYQIICNEVSNGRTLTVKDVNDHWPVFDKEEYRENVPETLPVGEVVVQVKAVDADFSEAYNHITYSIQPPSTTFEVNVDGQILLKERLNYTVRQYDFTVKAEDDGGFSSETRVTINIIDHLTPQFEYDLYEAFIPENQVGPLHVLPASIKAKSTGTIIYSIGEVSPSDYQSNFIVDKSTGLITVITELNFKDIKDLITIHAKASLEKDSTRTSDTTVTIKESVSSEVVVISLNQEIGTVQDKSLEMKKALERALGWSIIIISVSSSRGGSTLSRTIEVHTLQREDPPKTYVSFIATETSGTNVIPKDTVQKKLLDDEEKVLLELQAVFGPDVQFRVEIVGSDTNNSIILGAIIGVALVCIVGGVAAFFGYKTQTKKIMDENLDFAFDSGDITFDFRSNNNSADTKPDLDLDNNSVDIKPDFASDNNSADIKPDFALDYIPRSGNYWGNSSGAEWGHHGGRQQGTNAGPVGTVPVATNHPTQRFNYYEPQPTQSANNHYPHRGQNYTYPDHDPHSHQNYSNHYHDPHSHQNYNNHDHDPHPNQPSVLPPLSRGPAVPQMISPNRHTVVYRGPLQAGGRNPGY